MWKFSVSSGGVLHHRQVVSTHSIETMEAKVRWIRAVPAWVDAALLGVTALLWGSWRLSLNGLGNSYYTAADISGARSLRNLFFAAFDRTGIMAVDKPPLGLVPPALLIRLFGVSSWTVLGPQVVMFAAGIVIMHTVLFNWFNRRTALIACIVMLVTPINIAVARSNNPDEMLVLLTIVGLVCVAQAINCDQLGWVAGAGITLGLAFTTKQLQAVVAVPAVLVAIAFMSPGGWRRRTVRTLVFVAVAMVSCMAWIETVDHVISSDRPYVANSSNNTEFNLAFGFNGAHRVSQLESPSAPTERKAAPHTRNLFSNQYATQSSWLLGAALVGGLLAIGARTSRQRRTTLFLVGWTAVHAVVLAVIPGKFSPYYLAPLVPGIATLVAISVDSFLPRTSKTVLPSLRRWSNVAGLSAVMTAAVATAMSATHRSAAWLGMLAASFAGVAIVSSVLLVRQGATGPIIAAHNRSPYSITSRRVVRVVNVGAAVIAITVAPAHWALAAVSHPQDPVVPNVELSGPLPLTHQQQAIRQNDDRVLGFARRHATPGTMVIATPRVLAAAQAVESDSGSVAALGGFFGTDQYPTLNTFTHWISHRQLRWVAVPDLPPHRLARAIPPSIMARPWGPYARANCQRVPPHSYGGADPTAYWRLYNRLPLHTPLALFDCQRKPAVTRRVKPHTRQTKRVAHIRSIT